MRLSKREVKACALAYLPFCPDAPTVPLDDACHGGQANAGAGEFRRTVQAAEGPEQELGIGHVEAGAVVPHEELLLAIHGAGAEFDAGPSRSPGEFPGVPEQVGPVSYTHLTLPTSDLV